MSDSCPNCGAPKQYSNDTLTGFECGSNLYANGLGVTEACEYAASLRAERDKYKQQRDHWRGLAEDANRQALEELGLNEATNE